MARAQASDPLHGFRFHVQVVDGRDGLSFSDNGGLHTGGEAGFQSVTLPEKSVEVAEYKTGTDTYTKKFPGPPTVTNCTLIRGVTKTDTAFYEWIKDAAEGREYRADLIVYHWHRDGKAKGSISDLDKARQYRLIECFPSRVKIAGDLDSTSSEISLAEIDIEMEDFAITDAQ